MLIRKAKPADAEGLARLYLQFWKAHRDADPLLKLAERPTLKNQKEQARKDIARKGTHLFVSVEDGRILGYIELLIKNNDPLFRVRRYGYLNSCVVDEKHRRKGIAQKLTEHGLDSLKARGIRHVKTNVYRSNRAALRTWVKLGFKEISKHMTKKL
jgi:ribosomal protein S18 acetylase RimI-like enzyme